LSYDEFGNLTINGELQRPPRGGENAKPLLLNYSGRSVLDVKTHELRLLDVRSSGDDVPSSIADATSSNNVRRYDLRGDLLTLTILSGDGKPSAASAWKKQP
jgi:hypothetical protein